MRRRWWLGLLVLSWLAGPAHALDGLQPGMKAPALALETLEGKRVGFADFGSARAFLLVFWASWSQKSPEVLERAEKLHAAHGKGGLVVLGVNVERPQLSAADVQALTAHATRLGVTFPVLLDHGLEAFHAYGVVAVPSSVLVGPDLTVLATLAAFPIVGREEFFDMVEATVTGRSRQPGGERSVAQPNPRAVRYFNLGRDLMARGQAEPAATNIRKAVEIDPSFLLARVLLGQLSRERALAHDAIDYKGERVQTLHIVAAERERLLQEAEEHLTAAVRLDPQNPAALTELALLHRVRDRRDKARELLERALAVNADYPPARSQLGALLMAGGDTDKGRDELEAAIRLNPVDWRLHVTAAQAFETRGMTAEALRAWRRGVELLWQARQGSPPPGGAP